MRRVWACLLVATWVWVLSSIAVAAPYQSFSEFAGDVINGGAMAAGVGASVYTYNREIHNDSVAMAGLKAGGATAVSWMGWQSFVVGPRVVDTVQSLFSK